MPFGHCFPIADARTDGKSIMGNNLEGIALLNGPQGKSSQVIFLS